MIALSDDQLAEINTAACELMPSVRNRFLNSLAARISAAPGDISHAIALELARAISTPETEF